MIIGAYVAGLTFSKTDLSFAIQDKLNSLYDFLVPIFFVIMGMTINIEVFAQWEILKYGMIFSLLAVLGKVVGCMMPSLFMNFNWPAAAFAQQLRQRVGHQQAGGSEPQPQPDALERDEADAQPADAMRADGTGGGADNAQNDCQADDPEYVVDYRRRHDGGALRGVHALLVGEDPRGYADRGRADG